MNNEEIGHIKSSYTCHWRIPQWSQLCFGVEYSSPFLYFDDLKWSIKLSKGTVDNPSMLSIHVQIHESFTGSLRGIRKNVQLTLKINNTNPTSYYNDFGVGKRLQPVWFSEKNTKWGEDSLGSIESINPFLSRNQLSLSVNITILKSIDNTMAASVPANIIASAPFARYIDSPEFSDVIFKVTESDKVGEEDHLLISKESYQDTDKKNEEQSVGDDEVRTFYGHKNILAATSPWFNIIFTNGMKESLQNEVYISGVSHDIFKRLLKYCYTFTIDIRGVDDAYEMLKASDRFQITNIREGCLRYLRQEIDHESIWDIWECADMYGCEKTTNACISYASTEMKTLVTHSSWLYASLRVLKKVLEIEVGDLPEETELYEAVLRWAQQRDETISSTQTTIDDQREEEIKSLSMTRTQLLASVVDVEPLVISSAVVEPDEDDEDDEIRENKNISTNRVVLPIDPRILKLELSSILECIRFPMMPPEFLANRVEKDSYIMSLNGMKDMLYEAYKYHAVVGIASSVRCQPRRPHEIDDL